MSSKVVLVNGNIDVRLKHTPIVLLNDCLVNKVKALKTDEAIPTTFGNDYFMESVDGLLTPEPSTSSSGNSCEVIKKRKRQSRKIEYEVEKVVGYHIDKKKRMTYLLKWKGWGPEYNTFQTIEDMGNCNRLLMEYFAYEKPSRSEIARMDKEVEESVVKSEMYEKLVKTKFKKSEFLKFMSTPSPDLSLIFSDKFEFVHKEIKREYKYVINCLIGMCSHRDPGMFSRAQQYKLALNICKLREDQLKRLKNQEDEINRIEKCLVRVVNDKDLDILPEDLTYVTELKPGPGVNIPSDPLIGCNCSDGCNPKSRCCPTTSGSYFAYKNNGKIKNLTGPIYECNFRCKCPSDCLNRVVQHGRKIPVAIFKTEHCGWGVKTLQDIPKGSFVCEYFGEVITEKESVVREVEYFPLNMSYLFDLDFTPNKETQFCIDATRSGNFSRFINHSCGPNLIVRPVWITCLDPYMPQLAFFARRNIREGEELSFDYENKVDGSKDEVIGEEEPMNPPTISNNRCYCNNSKCREWLFFSH